MKDLVAYFSASGKTAKRAKDLAQAINADLYEIIPKEAYSKADLNYMNSNSRSSQEMNDSSSRPELINTNLNLNDYDTIFLGFPIWWGRAPSIIQTFLESYDFKDKKIILFATSGGSGLGNTAKLLEASVSPETTVLNGKLLNRKENKDQLKNWAKSFK